MPFKEQDAKHIEESLIIHPEQVLVTKTGYVIIIASAALENKEIDEGQTVFEGADIVVENEED